MVPVIAPAEHTDQPGRRRFISQMDQAFKQADFRECIGFPYGRQPVSQACAFLIAQQTPCRSHADIGIPPHQRVPRGGQPHGRRQRIVSRKCGQGIYGAGFIIINTLITSFGALIISFPISVLTALFIVKIAPKWLAKIMTAIVEMLASIPSVVYGVFAAGAITTMVVALAGAFGMTTAGGNSLLAVILLLAIMIFPTITSMSITAISSVDRALEEGSLALGATKTQTNFKVVLIAAKSGIFAGAILGIGRAFGEATAVAMVAGNKMFGPTFDLFDITRTLTSTMLSGLKETTGLDYDIRFSVGLVLMVVILVSNFLLNLAKKKVGNMS